MVGERVSGLVADIVVTRDDSFHLDVSVRIDRGRTVALLGPNGSGKSTTVDVLSGLIPLDRGRVVLNDRVLADTSTNTYLRPEDRGIGVVFQDHVLFPRMSVLENVAFGMRSHGVGRAEASSRAVTWVERMGLPDYGDHKPAELSGGQAQRVALARALATEPELLLLDEPLSALDVTTRSDLRRALSDHLAGFPGPRLLITHDPTEAFLLADEICVIEAGQITQRGSADDIRLSPQTQYAADLVGSNLLAGSAARGIVDVAGHQLHVADTEIAGPVLLTIHPNALSIHRDRPEGSPRNVWATTVAVIERLGDRARLRTGDPIALTVEVTTDAVTALDLREAMPVWVSCKATEIGVQASS